MAFQAGMKIGAPFLLALVLMGCASAPSLAPTATPTQQPVPLATTSSAWARYQAFTAQTAQIVPRIAPMIDAVRTGTVSASDLDALEAHDRWLDEHPAHDCYLAAYQDWRIALSSFILGFEYSRKGNQAAAASALNLGMPSFNRVADEGAQAAAACFGL